MNNFKFTTLLVLLGVLIITSCGKDDDDKETTAQKFEKAAVTYSDIAYAGYEDSYNEAVKLKDAVNAFVANPSAAGLAKCKEVWLAGRVPYGQTEIYRFYGGPIEAKNSIGKEREGFINAWPVDEVFIDYVEGNPNSGFINMTEKYPTLSKELLMNISGVGTDEDEANVSTGWHAIEFLLWGQDFYTDSAGKRKYTDYTTAKNADRRGQALKIISDLLVEDLRIVKDSWTSNADYRKEFVAKGKDAQLTDIFEAFKAMSTIELTSERMLTAASNGDQEDEHSCFSDNTHVDILQNFQGMYNVYYGTYTKVDGSKVTGQSYAELARGLDETKAKAVEDGFTKARSAINKIPTPFDQAILNNKSDIEAAITAIEDLGANFADVKVVFDKAE